MKAKTIKHLEENTKKKNSYDLEVDNFFGHKSTTMKEKNIINCTS